MIGWAARLLPEAVFVMYEQIRPLDPFGRVMQAHFLKLNSALHALQSYPDVAAQRQRFISKVGLQFFNRYLKSFFLLLVS